MERDEMVLVSIDDHVIEPADMFDRHMPERYRDRAPKFVHDAATGKGYWEFQGQQTGMSGLGAVASWPHEEWGFDPIGFPEMRPATYDADLRVRDMDANGQLAGMCFPTFAGFNGMSLARSTVDRDLTNVVVAAYNDWHIDELAGDHPGRFIPLGILPVYDPEAMATEIRRIAAKGCTAVSLPETPYGVGLPAFDEDGYWDPVFAALCDHDMAMCLHIGGAFGLLNRAKTASADHLIVLAPQLSAVTAADLMVGGVFNRFPDLKVALSEGGIGWISFFLDRMDRHIDNHRWTGLQVAKGKTPSELFRSNFLGCFITDPSALQVRQRIGIEAIAWECDYPHSDSTWPNSPELLWDEFVAAGCTDAEIEAITWQNACRFFRFDPFAAISREKASVGALRATAGDVDVAETSKVEYRRRWDEAHRAA
ncbi:MAG TPA: amidohydrolase family protein [Acidimicrobiales bacterium]